MNGKCSASPKPSAAKRSSSAARLVRSTSGSVKLGTRLEILLRIQPQAQAGTDAAAASLALLRARARHRLDRQALQAVARTVAADAREPGIDDRANARHRDRGFRHVGREHDPLARAALEYLALLLPGQARVEGQHFDARLQLALEQFGDVADLALSRQKHQHVAAADGTRRRGDLLIGRKNRRRQIRILCILRRAAA